MNAFWTVIRWCFYISLAAFLCMGAVLVFTQFGGVFAMSSELVALSRENLGPTTFAMASICASFAFILTYSKQFAGLTEDDGEGVTFEASENPDVPTSTDDAHINKHVPRFEDRKLEDED